MKTRLNAVLEAVEQASKIIKKNFRTTLQVATKRNLRDLVTTVDRQAEKIILQVIKKKFPRDSILAEETIKDALNSENLWLIDPLDGTTNYVAGVPIFCTSIAYAEQGIVKLGVIFQTLTDETFIAVRGKSVYLKSKRGRIKPLKVSPKKKLIDSLIAYDYSSVDLYRRRIQQVTNTLPQKARGLRILGSAALEFAWVGAGFIEAYISRGAHPWDVAAGILIVEEAGGKVTDWQGNPWKLDDRNFLASNGKIHHQLLQAVRSVSSK